MIEKWISDVSVEGIEKRRVPRKHYVYVVYVTWSDGTVNVLYRRYSKFYQLQTKLLDNHPVEAGFVNPAERSLPFLPGKILFGRSHVQRVALKRLQPIDEYCKTLIHLPAKISHSAEVLVFFRPTPEDVYTTAKQGTMTDSGGGNQVSAPFIADQYVVISDYSADSEEEVSLTADEIVEVLDKHESGWWVVSTDNSQGWVPSTYLEKISGRQEEEPKRLSPGKEEAYIVVEPYFAQFEDEITVESGVIVQVLMKNMDGWWLIRHKGVEGLVPSMKLRPADETKASVAHEKGVVGVQEAKRRGEEEKEKRRNSEDKGNRRGGNPSTQDKFETLLRKKRGKPLPAPPRRKSIVIKPLKQNRFVTDELEQKLQQKFVASDNFISKAPGSVRLKKGQKLTVHEQRESGWWYVETEGEFGWAPASHLTDQNSESTHKDPSPVTDIYSFADKTTTEKTKQGYEITEPITIPISTSNTQETEEYPEYENMSFSSGTTPPQEKDCGNLDVHLSEPGMNGSGMDKERQGSPREESPRSENSRQDSSKFEQLRIGSPELKRSEPGSPASNNHEDAWSNSSNSTAEDLKDKPVYESRAFYRGVEENETDLEANEKVVVIEKAGGWWYVRAAAGDGWVPSHYLRLPPKTPPTPAARSGNSSMETTLQKGYSPTQKSYPQVQPKPWKYRYNQEEEKSKNDSIVDRLKMFGGKPVMPSVGHIGKSDQNEAGSETTLNVQQLRMMFSK